MNARQLRAKHPIFHYQSFSVHQAQSELLIRFNFLLESDIRFAPEITIPRASDSGNPQRFPESLSPDIHNLVFHLGMVEAISYWKAACSPILQVEAGSLNSEQIAWWHDLFLHGLGEFFYTNNIDFTQPDFLTIKSSGSNQQFNNVTIQQFPSSGDLILVGGGKDSIVTLELTRKLSQRRNVLLLNPTPAMLRVSQLAGFNEPLIIKRTIDSKLLELNKQGYLNGHTPFSAYLAFLSLLVGTSHGFKHIIASNEESASQENIMFRGLPVNHQYSKSYRFEKMFRQYCQTYLSGEPEYFSFLRPLSELQIAWLFSKMEKYHAVFQSCNIGRGVRWCGQCSKCAFVFLLLSAFVATDKLKGLFGSDLFTNQALAPTFLALVGLAGPKPFDCVGTKEESAQAVALTIAKYQKEERALPRVLVMLKDKLNIKQPIMVGPIMKGLKSHWNHQHFLPKKYEEALRKTLYD